MVEVPRQKSSALLQRLAFLLAAFYLGAYAIAAVLQGAFALRYQGTLPFQFDVGLATARQKAALTCLVVEIVWLGVVVGCAMRGLPRLWDYILTVLVVHLVLSCPVTQSGPSQWRWWVTIIVTAAGAHGIAYALSHYLRRGRASVTPARR